MADIQEGLATEGKILRQILKLDLWCVLCLGSGVDSDFGVKKTNNGN